ncbi:MAG TPA: chemotaxis protein CheW [Pseudolabrys sp.]|jgi:purine-binding chemotaxis protein CheW|nr:chemotaxis protein CheW [Pseudolabrys sp.]
MDEHTELMSEYVTAMVGSQRFGLPILRVQDVFVPDHLTRVPLAPPDVAGLINLRGRIVTLIDLRKRLGFGPAPASDEPPMAIGIEWRGESYGLLVDSVGEVLKLDDNRREANPVNLDPRLAEFSVGIQRLDDHLLVLIDVDRVLGLAERAKAA